MLDRHLRSALILGTSIAIVAGTARADEVEDIVRATDNALRSANYACDSNWKPDDFARHRKAFVEGMEKLTKAKADHPKNAQYKTKLEELDAKADKCATDSVKSSLSYTRKRVTDGIAAALAPDLKEQPDRAGSELHRAQQAFDQLTKQLKEKEPDLAMGPLGKAYLEEVRAFVDEQKTKLAEANDTVDARDHLYGRPEGQEEQALAPTLRYVLKCLDRQDIDRAVEGWDTSKKLMKKILAGKYKDFPDVKEFYEAEYKPVEARFDKEAKQQLVDREVEPLLREAGYCLEALNKAVDERDEAATIEARKRTFERTKVLRQKFAEHEKAKEVLADIDAALRRSVEEVGEQIVGAEIAAIEPSVKKPLETLTRAIDRKVVAAARRAAQKLRESLKALEPYADKSRAKVLLERAELQLARLPKELPDAAKPLEEIAVPELEVDPNAPVEAQRALNDCLSTLGRYAEAFAEGKAKYDDRMDLDKGIDGIGEGIVAQAVERAARDMISTARQAEGQMKEARKADPKNPAVAVLEKTIPKLLRQAQDWKALSLKKVEYAKAVGTASSTLEWAEEAKKTALNANPRGAINYDAWPKVLENTAQAKEQLAPCLKILPDDHIEADEMAARADRMRAEAEKALIEVCVSEARRQAVAGQNDEAKEFIEALKKHLPSAKEIPDLEKAVSGTADARAKCIAEIGARGDVLQKRVKEAADAARPAYDEWKAAQQPTPLMSDAILGNLAKAKGKKTSQTYRYFGETAGSDFIEVNGETWWEDYDPDVAKRLEAAIKKLNDLHEQMKQAVLKKHGVPEAYASQGFGVQDCEFVIEVAGSKSYTPSHQVKDNDGRILGEIVGKPYPVPAGVIRGIASSRYVVISGGVSSVDAINIEGVMP